MSEQKDNVTSSAFVPGSAGKDLKINEGIQLINTNIPPHTPGKRRNSAYKKGATEHLYNKLPAPLLPHEQEPDNLPDLPRPAITTPLTKGLLQLFVKKGEYIYARPADIVLIESCDHLVQVYIAYGEKAKRAVRNGTLKDFLLQLPQHQFVRLSRFCAVNLDRLSGGNYNQQVFEFDFRVSIKLKHTLPVSAFKTIGI
ncbi:MULTISPECIES: LytTR family DNA-binding domain-containing protein [Niastella]|uniref:LytTR family transcriptional regulator n=1 Tax=Niastella soli TaxID=2821487 RepID=A0ABS3Z5M2_9BACT|nr:LytTR family DNA-binding domain-containing protein [Niastella soli]MBO9205454.1 LytTR family transcriptional regulator [Niastella soli]